MPSQQDILALRDYGYNTVSPLQNNELRDIVPNEMGLYTGRCGKPEITLYKDNEKESVIVSQELLELLNSQEMNAYVKYWLDEIPRQKLHMHEGIFLGTIAAAATGFLLNAPQEQRENKLRRQEEFFAAENGRDPERTSLPLGRRDFLNVAASAAVGITVGAKMYSSLNALDNGEEEKKSNPDLQSALQKIANWTPNQQPGWNR